MKSIIAKATKTVALIGAVALSVTACSPSSGGESPAADGGKKTLSIMVNAIAGGKNAAEAEWIDQGSVEVLHLVDLRLEARVTSRVGGGGLQPSDRGLRVPREVREPGIGRR